MLRVLSRSSSRPLTGREAARQAEVSPSQAIVALGQLESSGVAFREVAGRSHVWRLSEEHVLTPLVRSLFETESRAMSQLRTELKAALTGLPVGRAVLFGSIARGDERATSDIDLLVGVRSRAERNLVEERLSGLSSHFALRFGNPLSTFVLEGASRVAKPSESFLTQVRRDGIELES